MKVIELVCGVDFRLQVENDQDRRFLLLLDQVRAKNKKFQVLGVKEVTFGVVDEVEVQFQN